MLIRNGLYKEIREQYTISELQKKVWYVQCKLLLELIRVCRKYNIQMYLVWGSLLGAIRHNGFIPWDDDLDVGLLREDYDKLCAIADEEFSGDYFFQNALSDREFFLGYARLRDSSTTGIVRDNLSVNYNNGIFIDIYPLDVLAKSNVLYQVQRKAIDWYAFWARSYCERRNEKFIKRILINILKIVDKFVSYEIVYEKYKKWCGKYQSSDGEVGLIYNRNLVKKYHFNKKFLGKPVWVNFENITVPIPQYADNILSQVYGNYREYPNVKERGQWHANQIIYDPDIDYISYIESNYKIS